MISRWSSAGNARRWAFLGGGWWGLFHRLGGVVAADRALVPEAVVRAVAVVKRGGGGERALGAGAGGAPGMARRLNIHHCSSLECCVFARGRGAARVGAMAAP